ncbi:alpha/beta fold hydrolase [Antarcticimicrobium luteum]|uniref:Alpha/beta fold hydrolase n=1 Tax=Antarcticimicrobium luteum TaxID=2547397 RepID=A0A4R5UWZ8_9RHOB|nr:alpha/beta fold hydrolase [Antarcticimicrobium luteum]TDK43833.1 alpha/beta fold hydrolase [Antarcticimicrobium luteum]
MASILIALILLIAAALAALAAWTRYLGRDVERLVPREGRMQPVPGGAIHYVDLGPREAPVVVLIHGLSGQLQHFTYGVTGLLEQDYRVIALDRPGCGYSTRDSDELAALPEQARMIWALLDALGVGRAVLAGHSLGGAVALAMALERPGQVAALALICPLTHAQGNDIPAFKGLEVASPLLRRAIAHTIAVPMARRTAAAVLEMVFRPDPCPEDFLSRGGGALGLRPKAFIAASADYMAANAGITAQQLRYATDLNTPGGVLFGEADNLLPPDRHGAPMAAHGLGYEEMAGRGHMLPITAPAACADFIRRMAAKAS